ncbi:MAG: choice-of-anchor B family protein [Saprospiraceae bacterium]
MKLPKYTLLLFIFLLTFQFISAQFNMNLLGTLDYTAELNDIWGYVDPNDGTEYALVGLTTGVSIVSLADPTDPTEVSFISGPNSSWRDLKTYGEYAYVSNENSGGILVIDLRQLPTTVQSYRWEPNISALGGQLQKVHNLYVDEAREQLFIAGANLNNGGAIIADLGNNPYLPTYAGKGPAVYAHDIYTRGNLLYASEIYEGELAIYDMSNLNSFIKLGSTTTPNNYTHNAWLSDDGDCIFTTDERENAPVAAYDISDPNDIEHMDEYKPLTTLNQGVIPHNVHVQNDWLIISYYTDGVKIVDASRPANLIEVGFYDTYTGDNTRFFGAWGAYPFLPSGNVLVSDIENGLFVIGANYQRAAWLEGQVTDANTGAVLNNVSVAIATSEKNQGATDALGNYKTGLATSGTYDVTFTKAGYASKTTSVTLQNGQLTTLDVSLVTPVSYAVNGFVENSNNSNAVSDAAVTFSGENGNFNYQTNNQGQFSANILKGTYEATIVKWGFEIATQTVEIDQNNQQLDFQLAAGYADNFSTDLEWQATSNPDGITGQWERAEPNGTSYDGALSNPNEDVDEDEGDRAYVTGNAGGNAGNDDVDGGTVILTSPILDLTIHNEPVIHYRPYFYNSGGDGNPNDDLKVFLSNGNTEVELETITDSSSDWKTERSFKVTQYLPVTNQMTLRFEASDRSPGHLVEAGVDAFRTSELAVLSNAAVQLTGENTGVGNELNWRMIGENAATNFKVERSIDGNNFQVIATVTAETTESNYRFIDLQPLLGRNIYRLTSQSENGEILYSNVIEIVNANTAVDLRIFPNPIINQLNYQLPTTQTNVHNVLIYNNMGQLFFKQQREELMPISVNNLPVGTYVFIVENENGRWVERFVRQ